MGEDKKEYDYEMFVRANKYGERRKVKGVMINEVMVKEESIEVELSSGCVIVYHPTFIYDVSCIRIEKGARDERV